MNANIMLLCMVSVIAASQAHSSKEGVTQRQIDTLTIRFKEAQDTAAIEQLLQEYSALRLEARRTKHHGGPLSHNMDETEVDKAVYLEAIRAGNIAFAKGLVQRLTYDEFKALQPLYTAMWGCSDRDSDLEMINWLFGLNEATEDHERCRWKVSFRYEKDRWGNNPFHIIARRGCTRCWEELYRANDEAYERYIQYQRHTKQAK